MIRWLSKLNAGIRSLPLAVLYRISVDKLLLGKASGESQDSFRRWLEKLMASGRRIKF